MTALCFGLTESGFFTARAGCIRLFASWKGAASRGQERWEWPSPWQLACMECEMQANVGECEGIVRDGKTKEKSKKGEMGRGDEDGSRHASR